MNRPSRAVGSATTGWLFAAPALLAIGAFFALPVAAAVALSLTDFDIYALASRSNLRFVGLANYARLLADPLSWTAFRNTAIFVVVAAPLSIALSLGAALLVDAPATRLRGLFRTALFLPVVTTLVAAAVVWRYLYHPRLGLLSRALAWLGFAPVDWLGDPAWAMPAIILMAVWKGFGFNMVIFVAGLQSIPARLYEAAAIDGAGRWQTFRHVTLPMLAPTFAFVALLTVIGHFQLFAEPYVMTQGGPGNSTLSIVLLTYLEGFRWWNLGYATALSFALFAVVLLLTIAGTRLRGRAAEAPRESPAGDAPLARTGRAAPAGEP